MARAVRRTFAGMLLVPLLFLGGTVGAFAATAHAKSHTVFPGTFTISFATFQAPELLPVEFAKDEGFFAKYGLNPTVEVVGAAGLTAALESGAIQMSIDGAPQLDFAYQEGVPITLLGEWGEHENTIITARPEITSLNGLAGKSVGGSAATSLSTILMKLALHTAGVNLSTVTVVPTTSADAVGELVSGAVDAGSFSVTELRQAQAALPGVHALYHFTRTTWLCCEIWGYTPWTTTHKAETAAALKALNAAVVKWNADPGLVYSEIGKYEDVTSLTTEEQAYTGTQQIFNHGSIPLHVPSTKIQSSMYKDLREVGFPYMYNSYAEEGKAWTPTYWDAAFGKRS